MQRQLLQNKVLKSESTIQTQYTETNIQHSLKYRPDIDGLRAVAVMLVVFFHAFPEVVGGGFIGVDIFFVISGFLISTIILTQLNSSSFSFIDFYRRRMNRIFPALFLLLFFCFCLGWVTLFANEFAELGKHIFGGASFIANFILWQENGYFNKAAELKPLLHLWSLGIEEQFYIFWPMIAWMSFKLSKKSIGKVILFLCILSFGLNIFGIYRDQVATFYSPQTRIWEILSGTLLAYFYVHKNNLSEKLKNISSILGLILIVLTVIFVSPELFPGWWAIAPIAGSILIISAGPKTWINNKLLSHPLLVWIGLISYPLYLWHWPLLSFYRILSGRQASFEIRSVIVMVSIFLAWLTFKMWEQKVRSFKSKNLKTALLFAAVFTIGLLGLISYEKNGLRERAITKLNPILSSGFDGGTENHFAEGCETTKQISDTFAVCAHDSRGPIRYALIGDSKADSIFAGLVRTSTEKGRWLIMGGNGDNGAPVPVFSNEEIYKKYQLPIHRAVDAVIANPNIKTVLFVAAARNLFHLKNDSSIEDLPESKNYDLAFQGISQVTEALIKANKKIIFLIDNPTLAQPEDCIQRHFSIRLISQILPKEINPHCLITIEKQQELQKQYLGLLDQIQKAYPKNVSLFPTIKYLCDEHSEVCTSTKNNRLLYSYSDHISDYAAGLIGKDLNEVINYLE